MPLLRTTPRTIHQRDIIPSLPYPPRVADFTLDCLNAHTNTHLSNGKIDERRQSSCCRENRAPRVKTKSKTLIARQLLLRMLSGTPSLVLHQSCCCKMQMMRLGGCERHFPSSRGRRATVVKIKHEQCGLFIIPPHCGNPPTIHQAHV